MRDQRLILSEDQDLTGLAAGENVDSTNIIDFGISEPNKGLAFTPLFLVVKPSVDFASGGSATVTITVKHSADNSSYSTLYTTDAIAVATLKSGYPVFLVQLPVYHKRYLKVNYAVGVAALTTATINADLQVSPEVRRDELP